MNDQTLDYFKGLFKPSSTYHGLRNVENKLEELFFLVETAGVGFKIRCVIYRCTVLTGVQMAQGLQAEEKTKC